jgi:hypothetical protein
METSKESASKGGQARAANLTAEKRSAIARAAVEARWRKQGRLTELPEVAYGSPDRPLRIGVLEIPVYVLSDQKRVIVQSGMMTALDMSQGTAGRGEGDRIAKFIATKSINPYIHKDLASLITNPVKFKLRSGNVAYGYEATVLADLCDVVLEARRKGKLNYQQHHIADQCEILMRTFAKVGIIALIDEVTGFQELRDREALQAILDRYLRKEFAAWAKRFPDEFYEQIFRLKGWQWRGMRVNRPQVVAHYTNDLVYQRIVEGLLKELQTRNPKDEKGERKAAHHQLFTDDVGHPALAQHLYAIIGLMRASTSWADFKDLLDRAFPKRGQTLLLPFKSGLEPISDDGNGI